MAEGWGVVISSVRGSTTVNFVSVLMRPLRSTKASQFFLKEATTSSAVTGEPSQNFASRSTSRHVVGLTFVRLCASHGSSWFFAFWRIRVSSIP